MSSQYVLAILMLTVRPEKTDQILKTYAYCMAKLKHLFILQLGNSMIVIHCCGSWLINYCVDDSTFAIVASRNGIE